MVIHWQYPGLYSIPAEEGRNGCWWIAISVYRGMTVHTTISYLQAYPGNSGKQRISLLLQAKEIHMVQIVQNPQGGRSSDGFTSPIICGKF